MGENLAKLRFAAPPRIADSISLFRRAIRFHQRQSGKECGDNDQ
jgi:hypothetical protein